LKESEAEPNPDWLKDIEGMITRDGLFRDMDPSWAAWSSGVDRDLELYRRDKAIKDIKQLRRKADKMKERGELADEDSYMEALTFIDKYEWFKAVKALEEAIGHDPEEEEEEEEEAKEGADKEEPEPEPEPEPEQQQRVGKVGKVPPTDSWRLLAEKRALEAEQLKQKLDEVQSVVDGALAAAGRARGEAAGALAEQRRLEKEVKRCQRELQEQGKTPDINTVTLKGEGDDDFHVAAVVGEGRDPEIIVSGE